MVLRYLLKAYLTGLELELSPLRVFLLVAHCFSSLWLTWSSCNTRRSQIPLQTKYPPWRLSWPTLNLIGLVIRFFDKRHAPMVHSEWHVKFRTVNYNLMSFRAPKNRGNALVQLVHSYKSTVKKGISQVDQYKTFWPTRSQAPKGKYLIVATNRTQGLNG